MILHSYITQCDNGSTVSTVQERLTKQIASAVLEALEPAGVAVVIEAV